MNLPDAEYLEGCNFNPLPYFLIGGEIFPLKTWLMWPIPGKLSLAEQILNNRLSRARRVIENTFGILVARWRLYCTPIIVSIENAESYVLATLALHNYLRLTDIATYTPKGFVDSENSTGNVTAGKWHKNADAYGLVNLPNIRGSRYSEDLYQWGMHWKLMLIVLLAKLIGN